MKVVFYFYLASDCIGLFETLDSRKKQKEETKDNVMEDYNVMIDVQDTVSNINNELTEIKDCLKKETLKSLANCFKCLICLEPNGTSFTCCYFCGSFLGCYECLKNISKCPICNKEFKCKCKKAIPRRPFKIPGIDEFVPKKCAAQYQSITSTSEDDDDDDNLPIVLQ